MAIRNFYRTSLAIKLRKIFSTLLTLLIVLSTALAQDQSATGNRPSAITITASATGERVRFAAPSSVVQIRLEVYGANAEKLFDNELHSGNVLDWLLQNGQAERLPAGAYLCVVTVKQLSGKLSQKLASLTVEANSVSLKAAEFGQLTAQQARAVGPVEADGGLVILGENEPQPATIIAHNGEEGQITRSQGALSFRLGDFFSGKDTEQMRLTQEGNLGIGNANPQARLDVAGTIRASGGLVFPDGSIQFSAASKTLGAKSTKPDHKGIGGENFEPNASGTGTLNRIARWTDNAGTLGDANLYEVNGSIGINAPPDPQFRLDVLGHNRFRGSNPSFYLTGIKASGNEWVFQTVDDNGRFRIFGQDHSSGAERLTIQLDTGNVGIGATSPAAKLHALGLSGAPSTPIAILESIGTQSPLSFRLSGTEQARIRADGNGNLFFATLNSTQKNIYFRAGSDNVTNMFIQSSTGNVGIGTTAPVDTLDVNGTINTSTQYNIAGQRVFSATNSGTFVGLLAGNTGSGNAFFGSKAGRDISSGVNNSFFGDQAGLVNTTGINNTFFGALAGNSNLSGDSNTFFGRSAGNANTTGEFNTIIGALADVGSNNLTNAMAIGYRARVDQSNSLVLGSIQGINNADADTKVGIGTTTPQRRLHVKGASDQEIALESSDTGGRQWTLQSSRGANNGRFEIIDRTANASRLTIGSNGDVGIGTTTPSAKLEVNGDIEVGGISSAGHVAHILNLAINDNADGLEIILVADGSFLEQTNNFITFSEFSSGSIGAIQGNGSGGIELISGSGDYAEFLPLLSPAEKIQPGEIVGLYGGRITKQTQGASKVMAVTSNPIVLGNDPGEKLRGGYEKVAFIGQVMVRVRGAVKAGDFIVASGLNDGTGIAISPESISPEQFAQVVGQAWESSADVGVKSVRTAVGLIQRDPTVGRLLEANRKQSAQIAALAARLTAIESRINKEPVAYRRGANQRGKVSSVRGRVAGGMMR